MKKTTIRVKVRVNPKSAREARAVGRAMGMVDHPTDAAKTKIARRLHTEAGISIMEGDLNHFFGW